VETRSEHDLFQEHGVWDAIEAALRRRVPLPSGGHLVIQSTEALVTVDVNSGKDRRGRSVEELALAVNLEAAREIALQLRLRELGGIIVIDFIDLEREENRRTLLRALEEALRDDPQKPRIIDLSPVGVVQLTRKRTRRSLLRRLSRPCPMCHSLGYVPAVHRTAVKLRRDLQHTIGRKPHTAYRLEVSGELAEFLEEQQPLGDLPVRLEVKVNPDLPPHLYEVRAIVGRG